MGTPRSHYASKGWLQEIVNESNGNPNLLNLKSRRDKVRNVIHLRNKISVITKPCIIISLFLVLTFHTSTKFTEHE